jgi:hypothetical protein
MMPAMLEMEGITEISDEMRAVVRSGGPNCCCRAGCRADRKRIGSCWSATALWRPDIQWIEPKTDQVSHLMAVVSDLTRGWDILLYEKV